MKHPILLFCTALVLLVSACSKPVHPTMIPTPAPARPAGQTDVLGLTAEPIETVHIGVVGLGMRGSEAVRRLVQIPGAEITALCDLLPDRVEANQLQMKEMGKTQVVSKYSGTQESWRGLCEQADVDLVYICTDWLNHYPIAMYAMECGKHVAIEVPAALDMDQIWGLINQSEKTRKHCMMLENCIYDFFEMTTLEMAQRGLFGEVIHVEGAYCHNLDPYWDEYWNNWRLDYNQKHRGDVYPTHGMGPACQLLNIHRGDRMKTLVSMDTKAVSLPSYLKDVRGDTANVANGDHTMTMVRTELGKSMLIQHCTATPRPYSRLYEPTGTKGFAQKYPRPGYSINSHSFVSDAVRDSLTQAYRSPILTADLEENARRVGGHGGMDFIMDYRLVYCLHHGLPLDMDVYDLAEWCCISPLSALSLENDFAPVEVPDFTRGNWNKVQGFSYAFE